jgi:hypothetical protein
LPIATCPFALEGIPEKAEICPKTRKLGHELEARDRGTPVDDRETANAELGVGKTASEVVRRTVGQGAKHIAFAAADRQIKQSHIDEIERKARQFVGGQAGGIRLDHDSGRYAPGDDVDEGFGLPRCLDHGQQNIGGASRHGSGHLGLCIWTERIDPAEPAGVRKCRDGAEAVLVLGSIERVRRDRAFGRARPILPIDYEGVDAGKESTRDYSRIGGK